MKTLTRYSEDTDHQFLLCLPVRVEAHANLTAFAELPPRSPQHENKLHLWLYEAAQTYRRVRSAQSEAETTTLQKITKSASKDKANF